MTKQLFILTIVLGFAVMVSAQESLSADSASKTMNGLMSEEMARLRRTVDELTKAKEEAAKPRPRRVKLFYGVSDDVSVGYAVEELQNKVNTWFKANPGTTIVSQELQVSSAGGVAMAAPSGRTYASVQKEEKFRITIVIAVFYEK